MNCAVCDRGTRTLHLCPCEHGCGKQVCAGCWRKAERAAKKALFIETPPWLDLAYLTAADPFDDAWRTRAACGNESLDVFYPPGGHGEAFDFTAARAVCDRCPVRHECLAAHLPTMTVELDRQSGCYIGGTTPTQRTAIRRALAGRARGAA